MFYIIVILAAIFTMPAKADETEKWRHVHHYASNQSQEVGNGHILGVIRMPGIAFFPDGSIGTSLVARTYDAVPNSGSTGGGYYTITFADGSELWLTYTGENKVIASATKAKGTAIVIGGKGRYAGAKGDGTYEGEATGGAPDGIQYIDNVINVKKRSHRATRPAWGDAPKPGTRRGSLPLHR
jgi:hypothetical protein